MSEGAGALAPYYATADGAVVLYHGDCRAVLPRLDAADHVITDPPYARDVYLRPAWLGMVRPYRTAADRRAGRVRPSVINHQHSFSIEKLAAGDIGNIDEMLEEVAAEIARLTRRWALVFSDVETCHRWRAQLEAGGLRYVRTGAWVKPDPMPQFRGDRPAVGFEPCTIAHAQGRMRWNGGGNAAVWTYGTVKGTSRPDHPCPKPLPLIRELVRLFSDPGEVILDPFAGSGTLGLAARIEGRRAVLIEREERYCDLIARRLERGDAGARQPLQGMLDWEAAS